MTRDPEAGDALDELLEFVTDHRAKCALTKSMREGEAAIDKTEGGIYEILPCDCGAHKAFVAYLALRQRAARAEQALRDIKAHWQIVAGPTMGRHSAIISLVDRALADTDEARAALREALEPQTPKGI